MWGTKTRGWASSTSRLDENKWKTILQAAIEKMDLSGVDEFEGDVEEGGGLDPRAFIEL